MPETAQSYIRTATWLVWPIWLVACSSDGGESTVTYNEPFCVEAQGAVRAFMAGAPALGEQGRGGSVTAAVISELDGLNSLTSSNYEAHQHQTFVNMMTLIRYNDRFEPEPYLAESWALSDDGTVLEFVLRDDVVWHDGTPTTAGDVVFTFDRATDPETGFANPSFFQRYRSAEAVDNRTVRFTLEPQANPFDAWRVVAIMPEHLLGDVPAEELAEHPFGTVCPVGNGPFVFRSHVMGESWVFDANPVFPDDLGGPPNINRYVLRIIPDQATIFNELRSGGIDLYPIMRPDQAVGLADIEGFHTVRFPARDYSFIAWNTKVEKLSDARVRRALTMGIDRQSIIDDLLHGYGTVANHGVPPIFAQYDAEAGASLRYDPAGASALLTEAGWVDRDGDGVREDATGEPLTIEFLFPASNEIRANIGQIAKAQLSEIGVDLQLVGLEGGTLVARVTGSERAFESFTLSYNTEFAVNDHDLFHSGAVDAAFAWSGLDNPRVDHLIDALQLPAEPEDARALWSEYQALIAELTPWTYLYFGDRVAGVADHLTGTEMDARGEWVSIDDWATSRR